MRKSGFLRPKPQSSKQTVFLIEPLGYKIRKKLKFLLLLLLLLFCLSYIIDITKQLYFDNIIVIKSKFTFESKNEVSVNHEVTFLITAHYRKIFNQKRYAYSYVSPVTYMQM